ncbi:MAG TPA: GNAT family N-acetyltransferase [Bacilli bacterium]|nr:GNAT family N-acetyltransferase [Bacilli bacterium]
MEEIYLRELNINDGEKELEYLRNLPEKENGFENPAKKDSLDNINNFKLWLMQKVNDSEGTNLPEGYVPQTIYWIMMGDKIVGLGKVRHYLNDNLRKHGGNIGYGTSKEYWGKGIGTKALALLLKESSKYDQEEVLLTANEDNIGSRRVIEKNGGVLRKIEDNLCFYWIKIKDKAPKS